MSVHLIVRFAPRSGQANLQRRRAFPAAWLVVIGGLAVLLLLDALGCTSGGGPAPAPAAGTGLATRLDEADGGYQTGGNLSNQSVFVENTTLRTATSPDGRLVNESGFSPTIPPGGM